MNTKQQLKQANAIILKYEQQKKKDFKEKIFLRNLIGKDELKVMKQLKKRIDVLEKRCIYFKSKINKKVRKDV